MFGNVWQAQVDIVQRASQGRQKQRIAEANCVFVFQQLTDASLKVFDF
jgi:hypothetical protein